MFSGIAFTASTANWNKRFPFLASCRRHFYKCLGTMIRDNHKVLSCCLNEECYREIVVAESYFMSDTEQVQGYAGCQAR